MGLDVDDSRLVFAVVSRLTSQKGLDLVLEALPDLLERGGQLALLGAGDAVLQQAFLAAAADNPGQVGVQLGYHEAFSHRIIEVRPLSPPVPFRTVAIAWRASFPRPKAIEILADSIRLCSVARPKAQAQAS